MPKHLRAHVPRQEKIAWHFRKGDSTLRRNRLRGLRGVLISRKVASVKNGVGNL